MVLMINTVLLGSPPYTWGALNTIEPDQTATGITPIYMGSTVNQKLC